MERSIPPAGRADKADDAVAGRFLQLALHLPRFFVGPETGKEALGTIRPCRMASVPPQEYRKLVVVNEFHPGLAFPETWGGNELDGALPTDLFVPLGQGQTLPCRTVPTQ
jgi:hypothetical protein